MAGFLQDAEPQKSRPSFSLGCSVLCNTALRQRDRRHSLPFLYFSGKARLPLSILKKKTRAACTLILHRVSYGHNRKWRWLLEERKETREPNLSKETHSSQDSVQNDDTPFRESFRGEAENVPIFRLT